jgi:Zn-dependent protease with chaperone function
MRRTLLGAVTGLTVGYAARRAVEALRDLRTPAPLRPARDAATYAATRRALMVTGIVRGVTGLAATAFLLADPLERALQPLPRPLRAPVFALAILALDTARDLGIEFVEGHVLERIYATSDQPPRAWLADQAKSAAVGAVVGTVLVTLADAIVTRAPRRWPWIAIAATPPLLAFATVIAPTFVMPLFNRYEPVTGELETRIRELAARYGAGNAQILRFDMSRQTKKANAFVTGVLGTQRIALGDTLVSAFAPDETLFVVAHELGHYAGCPARVLCHARAARAGAAAERVLARARAESRPFRAGCNRRS